MADEQPTAAEAAKREKARQKRQRQRNNRASRMAASETGAPASAVAYSRNYEEEVEDAAAAAAQANPLGNKNFGSRLHLHVLLSEVGAAPWLMLTLVTLESCTCSPSVLRNSATRGTAGERARSAHARRPRRRV